MLLVELRGEAEVDQEHPLLRKIAQKLVPAARTKRTASAGDGRADREGHRPHLPSQNSHKN